MDGDLGCAHVWRLVELEFGELPVDDRVVRYRCDRCEGVLEVPPGEHPATA